MGNWAGYLGSAYPEQLRRLLGSGAEIQTGVDFALGAVNPGGEPAMLAVTPDGTITASIGSDDRAGCSAHFSPTDQTLTLACDPFGLHAVYTAEIAGAFWFTSDLRLLRRLLGNSARLDPVALHAYLCFSSVPAPLAILEGVVALPAGTTLRINSRLKSPPDGMNSIATEPSTTCPSDTPFLKEYNPSEQVLAHHRDCMSEGHEAERPVAMEFIPSYSSLLRDKLRAAIQCQLGVAREVGVFLSGGLDSSLIAALLAEAGVRLHLFSLDFGPPYDAELPFARAVAAHLGRPLNVVPCGPRQVKDALRPTAAALEQPFGDGVTVPLYLLGKAAAQTVETVFNGEGGDQLFGGWNNKPMLAAELYGAEDYDREAAYLATYHRFYGLTDRLYTPPVRALLQNVDVGAYIRHALDEGQGTRDKGQEHPIPNTKYPNTQIPESTFPFSLFPFPSLLHLLRAANLQLKGAQNIAPRARQLAAAHNLRVRSPFFDPDLTAWTFTLPPEWFLQGACEKYLLKRVAEGYLPAEIVWREKRGMGVPTTEWCLDGLKREVGWILSPRRLKREGWFEPQFIAALRRGEDNPGEFRRRRLGEKLWLLLLLSAWREAHSLSLPPPR